MAAGDLCDAFQPAARLRNHSRCALNQGFKDECRIRIPFSFLRREFFLNDINTFPIAFAIFARVGAFRFGAIEWTTIAIRRHDLVRFEQQPGITFVEQIYVPERNRTDGVAMIRAFE